MSSNTINIAGNLTSDPETRFLQSGVAVTSFTVASTDRKFDRDSGAWVDGDTVFLRVSAWRKLGENVAASLRKGNAVIVTGKLKSNVVEKDGAKITYFEIDAETVGVSLANATAAITRNAPAGGASGNAQAQQASAAPAGQQYAQPQPVQQAAPVAASQPAYAGGQDF